MKGHKVTEFFDDYILGEVEPAVEIRINEHLLECPACRRELEDRERLRTIFRKPPVGPPPKRAWRAVRQAIRIPRRDEKPRFIRWFAPALYTAAAFLAGMAMMRAADVISWRAREKPVEETGIRPHYQAPYSDTVQFYSAPAKNLARI